MNKEDYKDIILPIQCHKEVCTPLTETDINLLTNEQYSEYKVTLAEEEQMDAELYESPWSDDSSSDHEADE